MSQNFKTAYELGITEAERSGLIELIPHFRGAVCTIPSKELASPLVNFSRSGNLPETEMGFSMSFGTAIPGGDQKYDCGCVACIGGHLSLMMQGVDIKQRTFDVEKLMIADKYVIEFKGSKERSLYQLFYPDNSIINGEHWDEITPAVSADAIECFLITGSTDWDALATKYDLTRAPSPDEEGYEDYEDEYVH